MRTDTMRQNSITLEHGKRKVRERALARGFSSNNNMGDTKYPCVCS